MFARLMNQPSIKAKASETFNRPVEAALSKFGPNGAKLGATYETLKSIKDYRDFHESADKYIKETPGAYERMAKNIDVPKYSLSDNYGGKKKTKRVRRNRKSKKRRRRTRTSRII
jgi:hypothetical protein